LPRLELEEVAKAVIKQIENLKLLQDVTGEAYLRKLLILLKSKITPAREDSLAKSRTLTLDNKSQE